METATSQQWAPDTQLTSRLEFERNHDAHCVTQASVIAFHQSCYRNFKTYYQEKVQTEWASAFPGLVSYQRFIE